MAPLRRRFTTLVITFCAVWPISANDTARVTPSAVELLVEKAVSARNLGLLVLDFERGFYGQTVLMTTQRVVRVRDNYALLEELLEQAEQRRPVDPTNARANLTAIARLLDDYGFVHRDYSTLENYVLGYHTLSYGLARRELDCSMYVYIYLAIAEHLNLPLHGFTLPEHIAVRWIFADGDHVNWEPTVGRACDDEFYLSWRKPGSAALHNGVYLRPMSKTEVLSSAIYETGVIHDARRNAEAALVAAAAAVRLAPLSPDAYNLHGLALNALDEREAAIASYDEAINLDPAFAHAYYNRARCNLAMGREREARRDLFYLRPLDGSLAGLLSAQLEG